MNATEARQLTEKYVSGLGISPLLAYVYSRIRAIANTGGSELCHPLVGLRMPVTTAQREAVWRALVADGYKVEHLPDPDPGHYSSGSYTRITW
jgi:hypothetical protein